MNLLHEAAQLIKKLAMDAVKESAPAGILYGQVVRVTPLRIYVDQKITLTEEFLVLTKNVMDYEVEMTLEHETESAEGHTHRYEGRKKFTIHNALKEGDLVTMIQAQGGQLYVVIDKAGD